MLPDKLVLLVLSVSCMVGGERYILGDWVFKDGDVDVRLCIEVFGCKLLTVWGELAEEFSVSPGGPVGSI